MPADYASQVLDLTPAGYCLTEDNRVSHYHKTQITEIDADSYDVKIAKKRGVELGSIVLPHHFKPGDLLVWYSDIGILSGSAGYLLVRNRRVAAYRRMVMS